MNQLRLFSILLSTIILPMIFTGCTVVGYQTGNIIDNTTNVLRGLTADEYAVEGKRNDKISVYCKDGDWYCGDVIKISPGEYIVLDRYQGSMTSERTIKHQKIFWIQIETISRLERSNKGRRILSTTGLITDLILLLINL
ncbi:hypothetical protein ACFLQV_01135 [Calditrichota bacterium]